MHKSQEQLGREYDVWRTAEPPDPPRAQEFDEDAARMDDEAKWDCEPVQRVRLFGGVGR